MENTIIQGDSRDVLLTLPPKSVDCCVTSPPYWKQRDYLDKEQIGQESEPDVYIDNLAHIFMLVKRLLKDDGTCWVNIGDTYRNKSLMGIPWRFALAMLEHNWIVRQEIIWAKPNPMPESVKDRCTRSHEFVFMFSKYDKHYFDSDANKEPSAQPNRIRADRIGGNKYKEGIKHSDGAIFYGSATRNRRDVWTIQNECTQHGHPAPFPEELIRPCILTGCPPGGIVLDPFLGSGTTAVVANVHGRSCVGVELNPEYVRIAMDRS